MKTAILVGVPVDLAIKEKIRTGLVPQSDYFALCEALGAVLISPAKATSRRLWRLRSLQNIIRSAWAGFKKRHQYDLIISDSDRVGLVLALLLKLAGSRKHHVVVCHGEIVLPLEKRLFRMFRLHKEIDLLICYGEAVSEKIHADLGISDDQLVTIRHPVDHHFWRPLPVRPGRFIVSAGMAERDYSTLVQAVRELDVSLKIAAFSPWIDFNGLTPDDTTLPANVHLGQYDHIGLRDLYARSLFAAVPLHDCIDQSGSLVIYEAMAMGKAVIATRTRGQIAMDIVKDGETGLLIEPGDIDGWRQAIKYLCEHPEVALRMGHRARDVVNEGLNMESYIRTVVDLSQRSALARDGHKVEVA